MKRTLDSKKAKKLVLIYILLLVFVLISISLPVIDTKGTEVVYSLAGYPVYLNTLLLFFFGWWLVFIFFFFL